MTCAEGVIFALRAFRETADSVFLPIMTKGLAPSRYDLMGIGLMSHIKDKLVVRGVIHIVKAYHQFHRAEARAKMTGIDRTALYHIMTNLRTENSELLHREALDVSRGIHLVKQRIFHLFHH
jgi:hypothetical protein